MPIIISQLNYTYPKDNPVLANQKYNNRLNGSDKLSVVSLALSDEFQSKVYWSAVLPSPYRTQLVFI